MSNFENNFDGQKNIILQIDNLKKTFKDNISGESLTIIDGLSMKVFEGSKNIIIGESGSGKSTLLNIIGALDSITEGSVKVGEFDFSKEDLSMVTSEVDIKVIKADKKWKIESSEELSNALLGGLAQAAEEISNSLNSAE